MIKQMGPLNISYIPIMDNYPQYENVTRVPLAGLLRKEATATIETGTVPKFQI